jgi:hypothetical protein
MIRVIYNLASALSLLLCIAATAVWVRSAWRIDSAIWTTRGHTLWHISVGRHIEIRWCSAWPYDEPARWKSMPREGFLIQRFPVPFVPLPFPLPGIAVYSRDFLGIHYLETDTWVLQKGQTAWEREGSVGCFLSGPAPIVATTRSKSLSFQHWHLVCAFASLPTLWLSQRIWRGRIRRLRIKRGLCLCCGYDLRASTERCPECGSAIGAQDSRGGADQPRSGGGE